MAKGKYGANNRGIAIVLAAFVLFLLSGCGEKDVPEKNDYLFSDGSMDAYLLQLDDYYSDFAVDGDKIYLANSEKTSVYSGADGELKEFLPAGGSAVEAFGKEVYLLNEDGIDVYDEAGNQKERYTIEGNPNFRAQDLIVNEKWIVCRGYAGEDYMKHVVYRIDRETREAADISEGMRNGRSVFGITGMDFIDRDTFCVSVKITPDFYTEENIGQIYDLEKARLLEEWPLPGSSGVNVVGEDIYYDRGGLKVVRYERETGADVVVRSYNEEWLADMAGLAYSSESLNIGGFDVRGSVMCVTGRNIIYLFPMIHALYVDRLEYDNPPVRLIVPKGYGITENFAEAAAQFTARCHSVVEIMELPVDGYGQKVNLKLLAGDDDFDLYLLTDIDKGHILSNILEKKIFLPLEGYPQTGRIYDMLAEGLKEMHSYEGNVYALPCQWTYAPLTVNREVFEQYQLEIPEEDWTVEDVWKLCDRIIDNQLDIRVFNNDIDVIYHMIQLWGEKDCRDEALLKELLEKVRYYMEQDALAYENGDVSLYKYNYNSDKDALFTTLSEYLLPYSREEKETAFRHPVLEKGDGVYVWMQSAFLVNPKAGNVENALLFMEDVYASSNTYSMLVPPDCRRGSTPAVMEKMISGSRPCLTIPKDSMSGFSYTEVCDPKTDMEELVNRIIKMVQYVVEG